MTYTLMDIPFIGQCFLTFLKIKKREKISVLPRIFASIGNTLIIGGFGLQIINFLGNGNTGKGYSNFAYLILYCFYYNYWNYCFICKNTR